MLELVLPQLETAHELIQKIKILDALQEFELKTNPKENLCSQYQDLIANEQSIRSQMAKDTEILNRLHAIITDLYVDWERANGARRISSKFAAEKLYDSLESRDSIQLLQIFTGKDASVGNTISPNI